ncbi:MAG TPA: 6,7-dimethyl-8-ribityllumazine synthase [Candidatus Binataceae bacterium]|nr:6,7-dimethyl-8-ribityllumazine synthase [Candidatus Binataceae bacterium]
MKIALVVSDFNFDVTSLMLERARRHAEFLGAEVSQVIHVPGVFDMPLAVKKLLKRKDVDGVAILGAVIKGDTNHDELITAPVAGAAVNLALQFDKPIGLGITGPGMDRMQALDRIDNAKNAVESVVRLHKLVKEIGD